jgi:hypothetical protein
VAPTTPLQHHHSDSGPTIKKPYIDIVYAW